MLSPTQPAGWVAIAAGLATAAALVSLLLLSSTGCRRRDLQTLLSPSVASNKFSNVPTPATSAYRGPSAPSLATRFTPAAVANPTACPRRHRNHRPHCRLNGRSTVVAAAAKACTSSSVSPSPPHMPTAATSAAFRRARKGGRGGMAATAKRLAPLQAVGGPLGARPIGIGSAAPPTRVTNADLENVVETSDEWIATRTGIRARHLLTTAEGESISNLAVEAANKAIAMAGVEPSDIDLVVLATSSPDDLFGDATTVAAAVGASNAVAFDLTAACSGFLFSTVTAGQFLNNNSIGTALVVGSDALSRWVDWEDRNSCILFGDGAGAMVLQATSADKPDTGLLGFAMHSDGGGHEQLKLGYGGEDNNVQTPGDGTTLTRGGYDYISMNGKEVYKFATREVPKVIDEALESAGLGVDDIDWLLLHQANIRIMETVASRLGVGMEKVITNLSEYGNTSAASIPLALDEAVRAGKVKKGDIIACAGFGAGLSWGSAIIRWDP